jgi:catechol 2,3-dioxygenase-like lactoylglutathione lyase family enzyme
VPVIDLSSITLEVPDIALGVKFYTDAGLEAEVVGSVARLRCQGQERACLTLLGGYERKRLHHISLRANGPEDIAKKVPRVGGAVVQAPNGFEESGLWVQDPNGMLIELVDLPEHPPLIASNKAWEINTPGRVVRKRRSAVLPQRDYPPTKPRRLGHVLVFSPDVMRSVQFMTEALGMGLADQAQDVIAFTCALRNSDHHVVAFAKSNGVGFHHASFEVGDPDEVGRGGRALLAKAGLGDWGFGRHTIGSNFFHYIQDPWGSWFEYFSDMDHIDDYALWTPTNYEMEDSLASWGPSVPDDFVHNYEVDAIPFRSAAPALDAQAAN